jgi:type I restriction enzyme, S subunit
MNIARGDASVSANGEWSDGSLADLCSLVSDQCDPAKTDHKIYIGLEHINSGAFTISRHGNPKDVVSAKNRFKKNDILYGKLRPYLDKAVLAQQQGICSTDILVFRPRENVCPLFVLALIHSKPFTEYAMQTTHGVNHPRTSWAALKDFECSSPSLAEQEKVAAVLWKIQKAVEIEDAIVRNARELKKSLLRRLFTHGLRGEPLKETEIGPLPQSWNENPLSKLANIEYGAQAAVAASTDPAIGTPILTNVNILNEGRIDFSILRYYPVPANKRERLILRKGDVLFNWRSGSRDHIGKTALFNADGDFTYSSFILRFRPKSEVSSEYLSYYFNFIKGEGFFSERGNVSSVNKVYNASLAATIPVVYPSGAEQREIAGILQAVDRKVEIHESKKRSLRELFKTTLQKLMTAQIRVKDLNIDTREVSG